MWNRRIRNSLIGGLTSLTIWEEALYRRNGRCTCCQNFLFSIIIRRRKPLHAISKINQDFWWVESLQFCLLFVASNCKRLSKINDLKSNHLPYALWRQGIKTPADMLSAKALAVINETVQTLRFWLRSKRRKNKSKYSRTVCLVESKWTFFGCLGRVYIK